MQLSIDRRDSGVLVVGLVGFGDTSRVFYPDTDPHQFASYAVEDWSAERIVPTDRSGYMVEGRMIKNIRAVSGVVIPEMETFISPALLIGHFIGMLAKRTPQFMM